MARTEPCCDNSLGRIPMWVLPSTPRPARPTSIALFARSSSALASPHLQGLLPRVWRQRFLLVEWQLAYLDRGARLKRLMGPSSAGARSKDEQFSSTS